MFSFLNINYYYYYLYIFQVADRVFEMYPVYPTAPDARPQMSILGTDYIWYFKFYFNFFFFRNIFDYLLTFYLYSQNFQGMCIPKYFKIYVHLCPVVSLSF